jgi:hypothetical protein
MHAEIKPRDGFWGTEVSSTRAKKLRIKVVKKISLRWLKIKKPGLPQAAGAENQG